MVDFTNRVVLITGAGRGIGRAIALAFARSGASLAVNDLTPVNLDETMRQIRATGAAAKDYIFDIAKKMPVEEMIDEALADWGRIDFLINNAGVHPVVSLLDMDEWDLRRTLDVNLFGPFFTTQLVGRAMRAQGGGAIVNIAAALGSDQGLKDSAAYRASKQGLIGLTRAAADELAHFNIRVNAICPGWIETEGITISPALREMREAWAGQVGKPENVADLVLYLCGDEAAHLNGQVVDIPGG